MSTPVITNPAPAQAGGTKSSVLGDERLSLVLVKQEAATQAQIKLLEDIHEHLVRQSNENQFLWNVFLQLGAILLALLFGVFAILSYVLGNTANQLSNRANQLSSAAIDSATWSNTLATDANKLAFIDFCTSVNRVSQKASSENIGPCPTD